jgi:U3 small nucleolar ribonucleoprotein protein LCP5
MAAPNSLPGLLDSLSQSLTTTLEAVPKDSQIESPEDGVSLLDVKNELLLSYLQNLVLLILIKIRRARDSESETKSGEPDLTRDVVKKLVQLRLYLEKGVRPLEEKLTHTISTVLRAVGDSERRSATSEISKRKIVTTTSLNATGSGSDIDSEGPGGDDEGEEDTAPKAASMPNVGAFVQRSTGSRGFAVTSTSERTGVYQHPKINPTVMPTTERREKADRRPNKSATVDEYIATEFSTAPLAEPSIGTTIVNRGRKMKTDSERKDEALRQDYEEMNLVRLPKKDKKEKAREAKVAGRSGRMTFGGEEFRELGEGVDRIERLTKRKDAAKGARALLEKSRKRGHGTVDGPRGSGTAIGERFQKRLKYIDGSQKGKR